MKPAVKDYLINMQTPEVTKYNESNLNIKS